MLYVCVRGVMDVVFSVCIVTTSGGALDARNGKSSRNFINPFLLLGVAARCAPPSPSTMSHIKQHVLHTHTFIHPLILSGLQLYRLLCVNSICLHSFHHISIAQPVACWTLT